MALLANAQLPGKRSRLRPARRRPQIGRHPGEAGQWQQNFDKDAGAEIAADAARLVKEDEDLKASRLRSSVRRVQHA